jgi:hypothetical protein
MDDIVSSTKSDFIRAKEQLARALATTPDDRINWSPSPTSRTPVQIVAHAAEALNNINGFVNGRPFEVENSAEADKIFREHELGFHTREQALELLEQNSAGFLATLDALTPERLSAMVELPFGLGSAPVAVAITFAAAHTRSHIPQIEYIQTIYGDRDWHMPDRSSN